MTDRELITATLRALNVNADALARLLDCDRSAISHWRTGRRVPGGAVRLLCAMLLHAPSATEDLLGTARDRYLTPDED